MTKMKKTCLSIETFEKKDPKDRKKSFNQFNQHTYFEYNTKYKGILVTHYYIDDLSKNTFKLLNYQI